jgi:hypothetical protein
MPFLQRHLGLVPLPTIKFIERPKPIDKMVVIFSSVQLKQNKHHQALLIRIDYEKNKSTLDMFKTKILNAEAVSDLVYKEIEEWPVSRPEIG